MSKRITAHITWKKDGQPFRGGSVPVTTALALARLKHGEEGVTDVTIVLE